MRCIENGGGAALGQLAAQWMRVLGLSKSVSKKVTILNSLQLFPIEFMVRGGSSLAFEGLVEESENQRKGMQCETGLMIITRIISIILLMTRRN